ncbi:N-acetylmuramoyl-L-alanine amidase [Couchioplanes caeruleus]|uniref:N-acetylmuramoyl-L-alanine amidase n=1 Tax=Couchioplanes caeruleus TaxID=56438 RepID=UPI00201C9CAA|nr:N-acetylmuramoyl-L-alanine amidase [Couchioplanes caeruleus]UQU66720.1 N-acetylmuramoyl-L-alanine amidase [Couchioplanes caeruleus]
MTTAVALSGATVILGSGQHRPSLLEAARTGTEPSLQTIDLGPATGSSPTGRGFAAPGTLRAGSAAARTVAPRPTAPFSLVGVTWTDPAATLTGAVQVRTRSSADGTWTPWQTLEADGADPAEPGSVDRHGVRGSTDPLWVGPSDAVEARVAAGPGRATPLPAGLRVDLIDPGTPAPAPAPRALEVTVPPRPVPDVVTRAQWGADEKLVENAPEYTSDVQVLFVHHTAGTNSYSCSQSPAILRSIQAYHVKSKHWNDIGYNFLVDKCGTLFEGRRGGITRPVLGAHTLGFNSHSSAIAVLGSYGSRGVSARVRTVIAQVAAYKIGGYGNPPAGRVAMTSSGSDRYARGSTAMLNRISGHRDTGRTECPGNTLYAQLGSIRSLAAAGPAGLTVTKINGATRVGRTFFTRGTIRPFWQVGTASALMNRYDVYADGELAASVPAGQRQQLLELSPGRHTVRVRAVALNGRIAVTDTAVYADRTLPEFTAGPSVSLRPGSLNGIVPVRLRWAASDAGGLRTVTLTRPASVNVGTTATTWAGSVKPGVATTYGLRATDRAGNARSVAATRTAVVVPETSADRTGTWRSVGSPAYLGGSALRATSAGAALSWTFTGRSAALAVSRTSVSGRVRVSVDGEPAGIVDLRSPDALHRRAVWTRSWGASAEHTVTIEVEGTAGRPGVISDGLVYLR